MKVYGRLLGGVLLLCGASYAQADIIFTAKVTPDIAVGLRRLCPIATRPRSMSDAPKSSLQRPTAAARPRSCADAQILKDSVSILSWITMPWITNRQRSH